MLHHGGEIGVVAVIIDDEAGIDRPRSWNIDRMGMAADIVFGLVEHHIIGLGEQPGGRKPRNTAANNGDPLARRLRSGKSPGGMKHDLVPSVSCRYGSGTNLDHSLGHIFALGEILPRQ